MVLPPNPPLVRNGGRPPKCYHDTIVKFRKLSKMAVEYYCGRCNEPLGIIIDPDQQRINGYVSLSKKDQILSGGTDVVMGKPRKLSYSERLKLK